MVHRYLAASSKEDTLRPLGIGVRYVVASPSSYLYFDTRRPIQDRPGELAVPSFDAAGWQTLLEAVLPAGARVTNEVAIPALSKIRKLPWWKADNLHFRLPDDGGERHPEG